MKKEKSIHMIVIKYGYVCISICNEYLEVLPIRAMLKEYTPKDCSIGTFDVEKVTCKKCLKNYKYKEAVEKTNNPLFYWKKTCKAKPSEKEV